MLLKITQVALLLTVITATRLYEDMSTFNEERKHVDDKQLPRSVVPLSYKLYLCPNITEGIFKGSVDIKIRCQESTKSIVLHMGKTLMLSCDGPKISYLGNEISSDVSIINTSINSSSDTLTINISEKLKKDDLYELHLPFDGSLIGQKYDCGDKKTNNTSKVCSSVRTFEGGFFRGRTDKFQKPFDCYENWFVLTEMFPTGARYVFPCFDEPSLKAPFEMVVCRWKNMTSMSVMPLDHSEEDKNNKGWILDYFSPTPPISTFSVGVLVADLDNEGFESVQSSHGNLVLKVYHDSTKSMWRKEPIDLNQELQVLEYLEDYFGVPYPLPELKVLSLGRRTFRSHSHTDLFGIIFSPIGSLLSVNRESLFEQWLDIIVTPQWWSDFSDMKVFVSFLARNSYNKVNGTKPWDWFESHLPDIYQHYSTRRIEQPDSWNDKCIIYRGVRVYQMLYSSLTEKTFKGALRNFFSDNKYGAFTIEKLWTALTEQAWKDGTLPKTLTVEAIMKTWFQPKQYNYPVLTVIRDYKRNTASLEQHVFLLDGSQTLTEAGKEIVWKFPIMYMTPDNMDPDRLDTAAWMEEKHLDISNLSESESFIIINPLDTSIVLINYDQRNWRLLFEALNSGTSSHIPAVSRKKLLKDALLLSLSGELSFVTALNMTLFLFNETDHSVCEPLFSWAKKMQEHLSWSSVADDFNLFMKHLLQPKTDLSKLSHTGFENGAKLVLEGGGYILQMDHFKQGFLNIPTFDLYDNKTEKVIPCPEFLKNISDNWTKFIRNVTLLANYEHGIKANLEKCPGFVELLQRCLNATIDEEKSFASYDWLSIIRFITGSPTAHDMTFNFFLKHFTKLKQRFFAIEDIWRELLRELTSKIKTPKGLDTLVDFYEQNKDKFGYSEEIIETSIKKVENEVAWARENVPDIEHWFNHVLPHFKRNTGKVNFI